MNPAGRIDQHVELRRPVAKEERKNNLSKFVLRISDLLTIVAACKLQLRSNSSDKSFSLCRL